MADCVIVNAAVNDSKSDGSIDAVVDGAEFAGSQFTATFTADHYYSVTITGTFVDAYDSQFAAWD